MSNYISLQDITPDKIECKFQCKELNIASKAVLPICVLEVNGEYPDGSEGAPIGEYLRGLSVFLREIYDLDALILDLSNLDYKWGNNLLRSVEPEALETHRNHNTWVGYYVIGSNKNKDALYSLFCEFGKSSGIEKIYLSENEVMKDILRKAKKIYQ